MFKAMISTKTFMTLIEAIETIQHDAKLMYNSEGWATSVIDGANAALCKITLSKDAFNSYEAGEGDIGLDLVLIKQAKQFITKYDIMKLEVKDGSNTLDLDFGDYTYKFNLISTATMKKVPDPPTLSSTGEFIVKGSVFNDAIKASALVSTMASIVIDTNNVYVYAKDAANEIKRTFTEEEILFCNYQECESLYSIDYLIDICKILKDYEITVKTGTKFPVIFSCKFAEGCGDIVYLIAPRIPNT